MELLTQEQYSQLLDNGIRQAERGTEQKIDFEPVVKLFYPAGRFIWLLTELDPDETDIAWGLCDLGTGPFGFWNMRLSELGAFVERDLHFKAKGPISRYIDAAREAGHVNEEVMP